jgi:tetratricopeptide (TPR) repeat protein
MFFNNDDDDNEDFKPLEDILEAFKLAKKGEQHKKLNEDDYEFLIDYFEGEGDRENIKIVFELGMAQFPFSVELMLRKANWLTDQSKFGQALKVLDDLDALSPNDLEALFIRSNIYCDQGETFKAIELLNFQLNEHQELDKIEILLELTDLYDEEEEFTMVYQTLKQILLIQPTHEESLLRICFWADIINMQDDAILLYQDILAEDPFNTYAWYNLGVAYQGLKLYEKAIESYQTCIDIDEQFEYAYRNLGDAYIHLRKYDFAIDVLEKHIELAKPEDLILEAIGRCWEKKKDYTMARKYYREATTLSPQDPDLYFKIGGTYIKESKWEKATKAYRVALSLDNHSATYCISLAECLLEIGSKDEAINLFEKAIALKSYVKSTWQAYIKALYHLKEFIEAKKILQQSRLFCGDKQEFDYYEVALLVQLGKMKEAKNVLELALATAPQKLSALNYIDKELAMHPVIGDIIAKHKKKKN